jgi:nitrite reductase (NO-forming) / hydroxylamine reductase
MRIQIVMSILLAGLAMAGCTVNGQHYNAVMPPMAYLSDADVANVLTFVLNTWGNPGGEMQAAEVAQARGGPSPPRGCRRDHPVDGESALKYEGRAAGRGPRKSVRRLVDSEGPPLTHEQWDALHRAVLRALRRLPRRAAQGRHRQAADADVTRELGTDYLKALITYGSPAGMPNWGTSGDMSEAEIDMMARFLQHEPPAPPEFGMEEMRATWKVLVPPEERPTSPQHKRNIENFFAVTLRDSGEIALIDGDTKEIVNIVETGYAVHISRPSPPAATSTPSAATPRST